MTYKSLLVHLDTSERAPQRLDAALQLARRFGAHLTGLFATFEPDSRAFYVMAGTANYYQAHRQRREQQLGALERLFHAESLRANVDVRFVRSNGPANSSVPQHARYADLVIVGQTDPGDPESYIDDNFVEYVMMTAGRPVLLLPYAGTFPRLGERILIAWDSSREAARAAYDAVPFLTHAKKCIVVTVRGTAGEPPGERFAGADIALTLARHDASVDVIEVDTAKDAPIGDVLLSTAHDQGCDMIVMGGYGHARWRELVMGGATRTILRSMTMPVLMSH
ncbi:universal stress protein [Paraburkholderia rhizosphaerae]|uniref:Nucleotide-binding universal stress UspA family protein n=1 Tax=Paraburkholderia rhizosphaerae TaxID=480658 RepID=A0A4R8LZ06_9BURK|nr:universal stress protein [Paraburkholderia rhizosphaerae]TDY53312.1 nucleotide-binding universal stress UspA family protein [Paraburkholderia rhizosphaerae]